MARVLLLFVALIVAASLPCVGGAKVRPGTDPAVSPPRLPTVAPFTTTQRVVAKIYRAAPLPQKRLVVVDLDRGSKDGLRPKMIGQICGRLDIELIRVTRSFSRGHTRATLGQIKRCPEVSFYLD